MIELKHLSKVYTNGQTKVEAIRDINLTIEDGDIFGIIGLSGAGKSTLIRCINFLERPTEGQVIFDGVDLGTITHRELLKKRQSMSMIFQSFNLLSQRTALGNICYPLEISGVDKKEARERARELLKVVGLADKEKSYPVQLSGGQQQRIAIARALATNPKVLLCDEATSALDPQTTQSILQLLRELNRKLGLTIVLITHEMQVIKEICHHVAVMENGAVVEQGDVFSVFANPQQPVTRNFMEMTSHVAGFRRLLNEKSPLLELKPGQCILSLRYLERNVCSALVSYLSRTYGVDLNIIFGNVEMIDGHPLGGLIVIAEGKENSIRECIDYLEHIHVGVEVLLNA